ncbi:cell wall elongation regulator TseB-like domain-containing protein [Sutcliffiella rhizosphaerae]|uniref:Cell wall elongation regulator TseB-like domain-containing protein n=1 Tax=Sutcliffiella rhizosphaerae TaxID=2880967 RepID=A0ABN8ABQ3_9BACI|nr:DUF5590 domain-containing protein [Sutcliffiella rhizosphaerae]CAG9622621.1 putative protein YpmB [Sutcliffiella rhizosphaerae]
MKKWLIISGFIIVLIILWQGSSIYHSALSPVKNAQDQGARVAVQQANLQSIEEVSSYNGTQSYIIVQGTNNEGNELIVWVDDNQEIAFTALAEEGISKEEVLGYLQTDRDPKEIIAVSLAMEKNTPLWEIKYKDLNDQYNLYYIKFETGEYFQRIIF